MSEHGEQRKSDGVVVPFAPCLLEYWSRGDSAARRVHQEECRAPLDRLAMETFTRPWPWKASR